MKSALSNAFAVKNHDVDVCVVGGGMAGLCAAIAAARQGRNTLLVQDRPVLGGNASSEVRMWICGAHGDNNKETGILEEIQLDNAAINPAGQYALWDAGLWHKAMSQPNLRLLLNCSCCDGETEAVAGDPTLRRLTHIRCWQGTSQTWHHVGAKVFIDCSGDSVLAPIAGAQTRWGREARQEFDEDIEPETADRKTMGNTLLIQLRKVDEPVPFTPPPFAYRFDRPEDLPHRLRGVQASNFWWIELGGLMNTIDDAETIRDELMKTAWGVWDYIKNRAPQRESAANWALEWVGALPGKRENRRYIGGHTLTQNEVRAGGADYFRFDDAIAYGGWSMDDHHPAGMLYPGKPTIFHPAPSPYVIPYRTLYSRNIVNLMCAGRNISVTHAALSSTRVMATCALLGQAAGTAAALAVKHRITPAQVYPNYIAELQAQLMADDVWLPGRARAIDALSRDAVHGSAVLANGHDRPLGESANAWVGPVGSALTLQFPSRRHVGAVRAIFDSNLNNDKRMPCSYPQRYDRNAMPGAMAKRLKVETLRDGQWSVAFSGENQHRLRYVPIDRPADAIRLTVEETWGGQEARLFALEATAEMPQFGPVEPQRTAWSDVVAAQDPADLAPPDCEAAPSRGGAAIPA